MKTCKKCGTQLIIKQTQKKASRFDQPYYFTAYYFCPNCHRIYHDEKFKVVNESSSLFEKTESVYPSQIDVEIWTDGACTNNGNERAKASWAFVSGDHEEAGLVEGKQTNNRGEAYAILHALQWAAKNGYQNIKLHTDSQISLFGVEKHFSKVKANQDIFQAIAELIQTHNLHVVWKKVLGHSGDINNERVDKLANRLVS